MVIRDVRTSAQGWPNRTVESKEPTLRRSREHQVTVMLSPFAQFTLSPFASLRVNYANGLRVNSVKHLALLFVGGKVQSEILRSAPLRSE
jgi:hypothetical protein